MIDAGVPVVVVDLTDEGQQTLLARECPICAALVATRQESMRRHELFHTQRGRAA